MKRADYKFLSLIVLVLIVIGLIFYFKHNGSVDEETAKCIANKSVLYSSKTCGHCAYQKKLLGNYLIYFNIVECTENADGCQEKGVEWLPAWIISNKKYYGVKTLNELKKLSGC